MGKRKRDSERFGLASAVLFLSLLILLGGTWLGIYRSRHSFTPEKWRKYPARRANLVDDLLRDYSLTGMDEAAIRALLGEPDEVDRSYADRFAYSMGNARSVIESEWLLLEFGDGTVTAVTVEVAYPRDTE